jgi:hypothetical protein
MSFAKGTPAPPIFYNTTRSKLDMEPPRRPLIVEKYKHSEVYTQWNIQSQRNKRGSLKDIVLSEISQEQADTSCSPSDVDGIGVLGHCK